jgi:hypothetical protein
MRFSARAGATGGDVERLTVRGLDADGMALLPDQKVCYGATSHRAACRGEATALRDVLPLSVGSHGIYPIPDTLNNRRMGGKCPGAIGQDVQVDQACPD